MRLGAFIAGCFVTAVGSRLISEAFESDEDRAERLDHELTETNRRLFKKELAARRARLTNEEPEVKPE